MAVNDAYESILTEEKKNMGKFKKNIKMLMFDLQKRWKKHQRLM
jgi:hypothetical protein